jgi:hypothetical protein
MGVTTWMNYLEADRNDTKPLITIITAGAGFRGSAKSEQIECTVRVDAG